MFGTKALFIDNLQKEIGFEYLRFDYSGHGQSQGIIENQLLSSWINQTKYFIKNMLEYPITIGILIFHYF